MSERARPTCSTCAHWKTDREWDGIGVSRVSYLIYQPMAMPFQVRTCRHPYMANLYTAENFGCVRHEPNHPAGGAV